MTVTSTRISSRQSAVAAAALADKPLYAETKALFDAVCQHRFDRWSAMADEELDLVDITPDGRHVVLRTPAEVEAWFRDRYRNCQERGVRCETDLLEYDVVVGTDLAFSTGYFKQSVICNGERVVHYGAATVVWKQVGSGWKASRWHCSIERSDSETLPSFS